MGLSPHLAQREIEACNWYRNFAFQEFLTFNYEKKLLPYFYLSPCEDVNDDKIMVFLQHISSFYKTIHIWELSHQFTNKERWNVGRKGSNNRVQDSLREGCDHVVWGATATVFITIVKAICGKVMSGKSPLVQTLPKQWKTKKIELLKFFFFLSMVSKDPQLLQIGRSIKLFN